MSLRQVSLFAFVIHVLYFACLLEAKSLGITVDMIHRDSPLSPLYNPLQTPMERYKKAINLSIGRHRYNLNDNFPHSQVVLDNVQYLIKISVGSPPTESYGIVDTGSDLAWFQCSPCLFCTKQRFPIFNPEKSTTYKDLPCTSQQCQLLQHECSGNGSSSSKSSCEYTYAYGGGSHSIGNLATETLTLTSTSSGKPFPLQNMVFGCGHNNTGLSVNETGIFGLGGGPLSMVNQIGSVLKSRKLYQCLVPFHTSPSVTSKLTFGGTDETSKSKGVVSTPLVPKDPSGTYYFVTLKGFSVGKKFVPFHALNKTVEEGNMFIDSGTPPVLLPQDLYNRLVNEVKSAIPLQPTPDSQLCYQGNETEMNVPIITAHFEGGNVELTFINTFIPTDGGVYCFTMTNTTGEVAIFGSFAQSNFLIGFNLENKSVSFEQKDCTKG